MLKDLPTPRLKALIKSYLKNKTFYTEEECLNNNFKWFNGTHSAPTYDKDNYKLTAPLVF